MANFEFSHSLPSEGGNFKPAKRACANIRRNAAIPGHGRARHSCAGRPSFPIGNRKQELKTPPTRHYPTEPDRGDRIRAPQALDCASPPRPTIASARRWLPLFPPPRTLGQNANYPTEPGEPTTCAWTSPSPPQLRGRGPGRGGCLLSNPSLVTGHLPLRRNIRRNPTEPVPAVDFGLPTRNEKLETRNFCRGTPSASASRNTQDAIRIGAHAPTRRLAATLFQRAQEVRNCSL
jgi:hypothetical protein